MKSKQWTCVGRARRTADLLLIVISTGFMIRCHAAADASVSAGSGGVMPL